MTGTRQEIGVRRVRDAAWVVRLCLVGGLGFGGCGAPPENSVLSGKVAVDVPAEAIKAYQGTVVTVGGCGIAIVRVASDYADVDTLAGIDGGVSSSQRWLREGQLVVACGALHRVQGFAFDEGGAGASSSGRAVLLESTPAPRPRLRPGSIVLTVDGILRDVGPGQVMLKGLSITVESGRPLARFRVRGRDGDERGAVGGPGDVVDIAAAHHHIIDVAPVDPATGVPGWVELEGTPTP
jgi:hypothetical protein